MLHIQGLQSYLWATSPVLNNLLSWILFIAKYMKLYLHFMQCLIHYKII